VGKIMEKTARITYSYEIEMDERSNG
jgi:hypothetical protein